MCRSCDCQAERPSTNDWDLYGNLAVAAEKLTQEPRHLHLFHKLLSVTRIWTFPECTCTSRESKFHQYQSQAMHASLHFPRMLHLLLWCECNTKCFVTGFLTAACTRSCAWANSVWFPKQLFLWFADRHTRDLCLFEDPNNSLTPPIVSQFYVSTLFGRVNERSRKFTIEKLTLPLCDRMYCNNLSRGSNHWRFIVLNLKRSEVFFWGHYSIEDCSHRE